MLRNVLQTQASTSPNVPEMSPFGACQPNVHISLNNAARAELQWAPGEVLVGCWGAGFRWHIILNCQQHLRLQYGGTH